MGLEERGEKEEGMGREKRRNRVKKKRKKRRKKNR